ncbi:phosphatidylcholine synthase [Brucella neotomae]|nr:phosphatidylcholine synthase [Brucella neotomae]
MADSVKTKLTGKLKAKKVRPAGQGISVHLLTASGSFLAFLSVWRQADGAIPHVVVAGPRAVRGWHRRPIARKLEVKYVLPNWSGELLDSIIDYVTYVLIPAFALYQSGSWDEPVLHFRRVIVVSSAIYYADTGMKTKENFFKGFPVVWNMVVFTAFHRQARRMGGLRNGRGFGDPFLPAINFLHPVRWCGCARSTSRFPALVRVWRDCPLLHAGCAALGPYRHFRNRPLHLFHRRDHAAFPKPWS